MRGDIDTRLFDYFLYEHADVDKTHSLVTVSEKSSDKDEDDKRSSNDDKDRNH